MSRHPDHQKKTAKDLSQCHDNIVMSLPPGSTTEDCKVLKWMSRQEQDVTTS